MRGPNGTVIRLGIVRDGIPLAVALTLKELLPRRARHAAAQRRDSPSCRSRRGQCDDERVTTQHHNGGQRRITPLTVCVRADKLGDVADRCCLGLVSIVDSSPRKRPGHLPPHAVTTARPRLQVPLLSQNHARISPQPGNIATPPVPLAASCANRGSGSMPSCSSEHPATRPWTNSTKISRHSSSHCRISRPWFCIEGEGWRRRMKQPLGGSSVRDVVRIDVQ
jgi:hypothetical protein